MKPNRHNRIINRNTAIIVAAALGATALPQTAAAKSEKAPVVAHHIQPKNIMPKTDPNVEPAGVVGEGKGVVAKDEGIVSRALTTAEDASLSAILGAEQSVINTGLPTKTGIDHGSNQKTPITPAGVPGESKGVGPEQPGFGPPEQNPNEQGFVPSEIAPASLVYGALATVEQATLDVDQTVIDSLTPAESGIGPVPYHPYHKPGPASTAMTGHTVPGVPPSGKAH